MSLLSIYSDSPITRAEVHYNQGELTNKAWHKFKQLFRFTFAAYVLVSLSNLLVVTRADNPYIQNVWMQMVNALSILLLLLVVMEYVIMGLLTLKIGAFAFTREKQAHTWDSLVLTGIDAQHMILAKWLATLKIIWRVHRPLFFLRIAAVLWLVIADAFLDNALIANYDNYSLIVAIPLIIIFSLIFPALNIGIIAALSILASLFSKDGRTTRLAAVAIFFALAMAIFVGSYFLPARIFTSNWVMVILPMWLSLIDGGISLLFAMLNSDHIRDYTWVYLVACVIQIWLSVMLIFALLRGAEWLAVRQGATRTSN